MKFRNVAGLQLKWYGGGEYELIGLATLEGRADFTHAWWRHDGHLYTYRYQVQHSRPNPTTVVLHYPEIPEELRAIPNIGEWEWVGTTTIKFKPDGGLESVLWRGDGEKRSSRPVAQHFQRSPRVVAPKWVVHEVETVQRYQRRQAKLRNQLLEARGGCQLTGLSVREVLDACHIIEMKDHGDNEDENLLLLRRDLHGLFDARLLTFVAGTDGRWFARVDKAVTDDEYRKLDGQPLLSDPAFCAGHAPFFKVRDKGWPKRSKRKA